jgi:anti-sigma factor RsiW
MTGKDKDRDNEIIHKKLDGELKKNETKVFQKKYKTDPAIRAQYDTLKQVTETSAKVVKPIATPPDFKQRVIRDLKENI